jgi:DNA-binding MarR family transcriptional regulator
MSSVRDEIRQAQPFASVTDEGVVTLLRTTDGVRRALSEVVATRGITLQQYNVLRILRGAGAEGLPTLAIAGRMIETAPGITRLLERLEGKGLVRRQRCPRDSRRVLCFATRKALAALAALDRPLSEVGDRLLGPLGEDRTRELIQLLDTVRVAARNQPHPATSSQKQKKKEDKEILQ